MAHRVCPWWLGYLLVTPLRRWVHNPGAIVGPFVSQGMTVLELGPGIGFFTLELARRVGPAGRVIAIDVQPKMLDALVRRAKKAGLADRIEARPPAGDGLGIHAYDGRGDFALAFAVVHEVPKPEVLFMDICQALKAGAKLLIAEPAGHVRADAFAATLRLAKESGFELESRPVIWRSHTAVLVRN
jgi:ubiquinone/menaquinone biosynthesis C-methylase UbiE